MQTVEISLSLNGLAWRVAGRLVTLGMITLGLMAYTAVAGDKILLSDQPTPTNPKDTKSAAELFRSWNKTKLETPAFDYSIMGIPTIPRATLDRKEERRVQAERAEQKNWMLIEPGELQRKEEEKSTLGVANRPLDNLEKQDNDRTDYTFDKLRGSKTGSQQRQPGEIRSGNHAPTREEQSALAAQQREREESDDSKRDRTFTLPGKEQAGAHTASELNFAGLLDPSKRDTSADSAKSEFSLRDAFAAVPTRSKEQQARMDDFYKNVLNSTGPGSSASGGANPLTSPSGGASTAPAFTRSSDGFGSRPAGGNLFNSGSSLNSGYPQGLQNPLTSPGLPTLNNNPGSPGSSPFFPQTAPAQNSSRNWASPPQDPPRRKF